MSKRSHGHPDSAKGVMWWAGSRSGLVCYARDAKLHEEVMLTEGFKPIEEVWQGMQDSKDLRDKDRREIIRPYIMNLFKLLEDGTPDSVEIIEHQPSYMSTELNADHGSWTNATPIWDKTKGETWMQERPKTESTTASIIKHESPMGGDLPSPGASHIVDHGSAQIAGIASCSQDFVERSVPSPCGTSVSPMDTIPASVRALSSQYLCPSSSIPRLESPISESAWTNLCPSGYSPEILSDYLNDASSAGRSEHTSPAVSPGFLTPHYGQEQATMSPCGSDTESLSPYWISQQPSPLSNQAPSYLGGFNTPASVSYCSSPGGYSVFGDHAGELPWPHAQPTESVAAEAVAQTPESLGITQPSDLPVVVSDGNDACPHGRAWQNHCPGCLAMA